MKTRVGQPDGSDSDAPGDGPAFAGALAAVAPTIDGLFAAVDASGCVHDVKLKRYDRWFESWATPITVAVIAGLATGLLFVLQYMTRLRFLPAWVVPLPIVLVLLAVYAARRMRRSVELARMRPELDGLVAAGPAALAGIDRLTTELPVAVLFEETLRALARSGCVGQVVRIGWAGEGWPMVAAVQPFEPIPLDAWSAGFKSVAEQASPPLMTGVNAASANAAGWATAFDAAVVQQMILRAAMGAPLAMTVLHEIRIALTTGRLTWSGMLMICLCVAPIWALVIGRWFGPQWFAVPGGVVSRRSIHGRAAWDVRLFTRRRANLCLHIVPDFGWMVIVADGTRLARRRLAPAEADLLLRAWLSPLEPPGVEQLADLA